MNHYNLPEIMARHSQLKFEKPIFVTKPILPSLDIYRESLDTIWESGILSNKAKYHKLLEKKHGKKFECKYYDIINMYNKDDIINIIEQLRYWFPYEEDFIWFINWLEKMSEYEIIHIEID